MTAHPTSSACAGFHAAGLSRRQALKVGGLGLFGLTLPGLLRAEADQRARAMMAHAAAAGLKARAKSVIFLFQFGGPSHVDMFDMKPDAAENVRGPHQPIASKADGIQVSERLPQTARIMDKVTLIRSMTHPMTNHNSAAYYALTGHAPPTDDIRLRDSLDLFPAYGSVVDYLAPLPSGEVPTSISYPHVISDGSVTPGQHASFLGKAHDPFLFTQDPNGADFSLPELSLPAGVSFERMQARRELQRLVDRQARLMDHAPVRGFDAYYDRAMTMLQSPRLREAFNLAAEPAAVREAYGRTTYGQSCLLARRLVEAGAKFITVYFSSNIGGQSTKEGGWDTHGFNDTRMFPIIEEYHLPITEHTLPTLLNDLDTRGLLDETLVVWAGEFGRTPNINKNVSRDHWPHCYTVLLAGGGVKRGFVHGASDRTGAYPLEKPVRPEDLAATVYAALGFDADVEVLNHQQRPVRLCEGRPVLDVFA
ncbi:MAG TPA: DUF1501 domain-containing protein [Verrucomicrobiota bacterium]|nr:DUF1501 domain-containing protein [Verrucomicrobiota bacterium]